MEVSTLIASILQLANQLINAVQLANQLIDVVATVSKQVKSCGTHKVNTRELEILTVNIDDRFLKAEEVKYQNLEARLVIDKLKDVIGDAKDVLDAMDCQAKKKHRAEMKGAIGNVSLFFSKSNPYVIRRKLTNEVQKIRDRLKEIEHEYKGIDFTTVERPPFLHTHLQTSYNGFEPDLKRCFAFFSIFPKDYVFDSRYLVHCWMALGLVKTRSELEMEGVGLEYLKTLNSNGFLQDIRDYGLRYTFKMDNHAHDLATSVASAEYSRVSFGTHKIDTRVRHLSMIECSDFEEGHDVVIFLKQPMPIQTIFFPEKQDMSGEESLLKHDMFGSKRVLEKCILNLKRLHMLRMNNTSFEKLPNSIGALIHLRFLDLSENPYLKKLPKSLCELQSLQTLKLVGCTNLEKLPSRIRNLISLRYLEITVRCYSLPMIKEGRWRSLRHLGLHECSELQYLFKGMKKFTNLRSLEIVNCPELQDLAQTLYHLRALTDLKIQDPHLSAQCKGDPRLKHIKNVQLC